MAIQEQAQKPSAGAWYRDPLDRRFEVVSVDEESGVIQVRYHDGEGGELTLADWRHAMLERDGMLEDYLTSSDAEEES